MFIENYREIALADDMPFSNLWLGDGSGGSQTKNFSALFR